MYIVVSELVSVCVFMFTVIYETWTLTKSNIALLHHWHRNDRDWCCSPTTMQLKARVTPDLIPCYDLARTKTYWNRWQVVDRSHDWSQRSWLITRPKSVVARSMIMFKNVWPAIPNRIQILYVGTTSLSWLYVQLVTNKSNIAEFL